MPNYLLLPPPADRYVVAFRKWVNQFGADPFLGQAFPPEQSVEALMDRCHSHTQHCGSCRLALARLQRIRKALLVVCAVVWSCIPLVVFIGGLFLLASVLLSGIPLLAGAAWLWLTNLEKKFYQNDPIPCRNLV